MKEYEIGGAIIPLRIGGSDPNRIDRIVKGAQKLRGVAVAHVVQTAGDMQLTRINVHVQPGQGVDRIRQKLEAICLEETKRRKSSAA